MSMAVRAADERERREGGTMMKWGYFANYSSISYFRKRKLCRICDVLASNSFACWRVRVFIGGSLTAGFVPVSLSLSSKHLFS